MSTFEEQQDRAVQAIYEIRASMKKLLKEFQNRVRPEDVLIALTSEIYDVYVGNPDLPAKFVTMHLDNVKTLINDAGKTQAAVEGKAIN